VLKQQQSAIPIPFEALEERFSQKQQEAKQEATDKKPAGKTVISLLDGKRSMAVNIVIKLFKAPIDEIIRSLQKLDVEVSACLPVVLQSQQRILV
jgi:hypothetical protein